MFPFQPNPQWYENHWYSQPPVKLPWRTPVLLVSLTALVFAAWPG